MTKHQLLISKRSIIGLLVLCAIHVQGAYAFTVPPYAGFVTDRVGVLTAEEQQNLEQTLSAYRAETSNEIAILIVSTLDGESIVDAAVETGRQWGVGQGDKNNGILLLIAISDREMFLATGYGLEGAVPDITARNIIDTKIAPFFKQGEYYQGLQSGITALKEAIGGEYVAEELPSAAGFDLFQVIFFVIFFVFPWLGAILGRTKSWWLGGVLGAIGGCIFWLIFSAFIAVPALAVIGLIFDYLVSKNYKSNRRNSWWSGGGWGPGGSGGRSGGGFGGFSGGSFGGGGSRGSW